MKNVKNRINYIGFVFGLILLIIVFVKDLSDNLSILLILFSLGMITISLATMKEDMGSEGGFVFDEIEEEKFRDYTLMDKNRNI